MLQLPALVAAHCDAQRLPGTLSLCSRRTGTFRATARLGHMALSAACLAHHHTTRPEHVGGVARDGT